MAAPRVAASPQPDDLAAFTRWLPAGEGGTLLAESSLRLGGLHCAACSGTIEAALAAVDGVRQAHVSAASGCATVRWDPARTQPSALVQAIERAGYQAVPDTAAGARALRQRESRQALWRLFVAGLCAMQVMMLATPAYVSRPGELAADLKQLLDWGSWLLTLPVLCFSAWPFFQGAWRAARSRRIGMDVPVALGIAVAFIASSGATFDPGGLFGREVYFDSLTMFIAFLLGGRLLETRARHRAAALLEDTFGRLPHAVLRDNADGSVEPVPLHRVQPGDRLRVPAGETFAADGVLLDGATEVDESLLSGESTPVPKRAGDALVAGSVNGASPVRMQVQRLGADTRYEAIVGLMRQAQTLRPASLARSDRWAGPFLWTVLALAAAAGLAWHSIDPSRAVGVAVAVLIVTCPCALSLAAPAALLSATAAMARRGLLLRRLEAIDGLARIDTLFVDKTGTLTDTQQPGARLERLTADARWSDDDLRRIAASIAGWSSHPISRAIAVGAAGEADDLHWRLRGEVAGKGLQAIDREGRLWRLGAPGWAGVPVQPGGAAAVAVLSVDRLPLAGFHLEEQPRPGVAASVRALQQAGVRVVLLSGDAAPRVQRFAERMGLQRWHGGLAPEDKLARVRQAQAQGHVVAMLGDGINDAPVLAQADVSLAMGAGAAVARGEADGVLVSNRLQDVADARTLACRARRIVRQNTAWSLAYNAACVPMALLGWLPPWAAGLGMAGSSLLVVLNALRLAR